MILEEKLTAEEKERRGMHLSGADIAELLKNPKHWLSQLWSECLKKAAYLSLIDFIRFVESSIREFELSQRYERTSEQPMLALPVAHKPEIIERALLNEQLSPMTVNKIQLQSALQLLHMPVQAMTPAQLIIHSQQLTTIAHNQILTALGPTITFQVAANGTQPAQTVTYNINQTTAIDVPIDKILRVNPALAKYLAGSSEEVQNAFAAGEAKQQTYGVNKAIKMLREILDGNHSAYELNQVRDLVTKVDSQVHECGKIHQPVIDRKTEVNELLLKQHLKDIAKQAAPYANFPTELANEGEVFIPEPVPASLTQCSSTFFAKDPMSLALRNAPKLRSVQNIEPRIEQDWWKRAFCEESKIMCKVF